MDYKIVDGQIYKIINEEDILLTQEEIEATSFKIINGIPYELTQEEIDEKTIRDTEYVNTCLENTKQSKIDCLRIYTTNKIYESYPLLKQIDIIGRLHDYGEVDFTNMNTFINDILDSYHAKKILIESCITIEDVELININF